MKPDLGLPLPAAGWYADPGGLGLRFWDGSKWTEHVDAGPARSSIGGDAASRRVLVVFALTLTVMVGSSVTAIVVLRDDAARALRRRADRFASLVPDRYAIKGAPGYRTFSGPLGRPMATGRPWGRPCQPLRFAAHGEVPDDVFGEIETVINEARTAGLNVTLENRFFQWSPRALHYPAGMGPLDAREVWLYGDTSPPPTHADGGPERVDLGWNARADDDGRHEVITLAQATLRLTALEGAPARQRTAVRQLVALTQGVHDTADPTSGLRRGTAVDEFSPSDIAAMKLMSGCHNMVPPPPPG